MYNNNIFGNLVIKNKKLVKLTFSVQCDELCQWLVILEQDSKLVQLG